MKLTLLILSVCAAAALGAAPGCASDGDDGAGAETDAAAPDASDAGDAAEQDAAGDAGVDVGVDTDTDAALPAGVVRVEPREATLDALAGATRSTTLRIRNDTDADVIVTGIGRYDGEPAWVRVDAPAFPAAIAPGDRLPFAVVADLRAAVGVTPARARLWVALAGRSTALTADVAITVFADTCPVPAITVAEGEDVPVAAAVHADGSGSRAFESAVTGWEWDAVGPARPTFVPSAFVAAPTVRFPRRGYYELRLAVVDASGRRSCAPARLQLAVGEPEARVELVWRTPGDPDDAAASEPDAPDLDLHAAPVGATGPWDYDGDGAREPWFGPDDAWEVQPAVAWPVQAPWEQRAELAWRGGAGAESLELRNLGGARVALAVHVWREGAWGPSFATVRVYGGAGEVLFDRGDVGLCDGDLWEIGVLDGATGTFTPGEVDGAAVVEGGWYEDPTPREPTPGPAGGCLP
ncbi:MAG: hypothetical protein KC635_19285 [Myxococcales bacterium]|nr:hypothetical protein [Myxococcales bacterium]MCB9737352.1 hypothetical protein [Deltaproteobacteria bacterium]